MDNTEGKTWGIIGHNKIIKFLKTSLFSDNLAHAYLFLGPESVGKKKVAFEFINAVLCRHNGTDKKSFPCHSCPTCQKFRTDIFSDLRYLDRMKDKDSIGVDEIRSLIHFLNLKPSLTPYKFAVIEADYLTLEACNSFLKKLEEPAPNTIIFLLASNKNNLPQTIVSRCQIIRFNPVKETELTDFLLKAGLSGKTAKEMAYFSQGRPGKALKYFEHPELFESYKQEVGELLDTLKEKVSITFEAVSDLLPAKLKPSGARECILRKLSIILHILRDGLLLKSNSKATLTNYGLKSRMQNYFKDKDTGIIIELIIKNLQTQRLISLNINPRLAFENYILNFSKNI